MGGAGNSGERCSASRPSRPYFSVPGTELRKSLPIPGARLYIEGHLSSRSIQRLARRMLHTVRRSDQGFQIELDGQVAPASGATPFRRGAATSVREDFSGRRPRAFWLHDNRHDATRWNEAPRGTCDKLATCPPRLGEEKSAACFRKGRTGPDKPRSLRTLEKLEAARDVGVSPVSNHRSAVEKFRLRYSSKSSIHGKPRVSHTSGIFRLLRCALGFEVSLVTTTRSGSASA